MAENSSLSPRKVWGETPQEIFSPTYCLIRQRCLYLLAWVQLFSLTTACTASLSCQWVTFNACKMVCLTFTLLKHKQSMDCPNRFLKSQLCTREGREWLAALSSAILCHRRMASTWQHFSSLHLWCDATVVELSESVTKAGATWSPMFKA